MSARTIATVGLELASTDTEHFDLDSRQSLLDWDIILFKPEIHRFFYAADSYLGKRCLDDSHSFRLKECCEHWRREIKEAVTTGKTVVVYLSELEEVYVATGQRTHSGTGRNRQTTRHVELFNNYQAIPAELSPIATTGTSMKLTPRAGDVLAAYWSEFESVSQYQVVLTNPKVSACIVTRSGDKAVGSIFRSKRSPGALILFPDIDFYDDDFLSGKGKKDWTPAAGKFAARLIKSIVELDRALRATSELTPEPPWATNSRFVLAPEAPLRVKLLEAERMVEQAQKDKEAVTEDLASAGRFRALLYEKGKPLESAIIEALKVLGFSAAPYKDSDSEFDVIFESAQGRLIGEAEGKDNKAKHRQAQATLYEHSRGSAERQRQDGGQGRPIWEWLSVTVFRGKGGPVF